MSSFIVTAGKNIGLEVLLNDFAKRSAQSDEMVTQHITLSSDWTDGPPVALFRADGCWCVRYASGNWWHYSLKDRVWF